jgi:hypothetical protein
LLEHFAELTTPAFGHPCATQKLDPCSITAAVAEFKKVLDHRGLLWNCVTGVLAHLGLARAHALQAQTDRDAIRAKARSAYQDFLALWKDADPDIPILKEAKAEYAKLW